MSIALTVGLIPSKKLHLLAILFSILIIFIGTYIGNIEPLPIHWRAFLTIICFIASIINYLHIRSLNRKKWRIAVNRQGEFRCQLMMSDDESHDFGSLCPYFLIAGTTIWSGILFLRLQSCEGDAAINLVIFSDALNKDEFRRMSIACRWIVKHTK